MEFKTKFQQDTYEKILPWMREIFGEFAKVHPDQPLVRVNYGSTIAWVSVDPWGDDDATVSARSYVVTGAEMTLELMEFLLKSNDNVRFGAFGLDTENDIFFDHTVVGSTCDKEDLKATIMAVIMTADEFDDKIVSRWGGRRATDNK